MSERDYNAEEEDPELYKLALSGIKKSRAAVQRVAREYLGQEDILTDVEVKQHLELSNNTLRTVLQVLDPKHRLSENRSIVAITIAIVYSAELAMRFLV